MKQVNLKQVIAERQTNLPKLVDDREAAYLVALGSVHVLGYSPRELLSILTRLMTDYGYLSEQDQPKELEKRVLKIYDSHQHNNLGGIFASAQQTLTGSQREHAFALTAQLLYNVEPNRQQVNLYLQDLAVALELAGPTVEKIDSWARKQPIQDEFRSRHPRPANSAPELGSEGDTGSENEPELEGTFAESMVSLFLEAAQTDEEQLDTIVAFLREDGWPVQVEEQQLRVFTTYQGKNAQFNAIIRLRAKYSQLICYSLFPQAIPAARRNAVSIFLALANYGTIIGNFEMDFNDGEVRYKTSVDFENVSLSPALIRNIIYPNVMTMDRYISGIFSLIYSNRDPHEVLADIERN
jgi:hypothetical protein